jgi:hypothetical protein
MAIFIGIDTVLGVVVEAGIGIAFGVLFSSSTTVSAFEVAVVVNGKLLIANAFCNFCFCIIDSAVTFSTFSCDDIVEEMVEKGCRVKGDLISRTTPAPNEYLRIEISAILSTPLLAA